MTKAGTGAGVILGVLAVLALVSAFGKERAPASSRSTEVPSVSRPPSLTLVPMLSSAPPMEPRVVPWDSGVLGRSRPREGNPEGPTSFAVVADGLLVLDRVNGRLVRLGGTSIPLDLRAPDDLAVAADGTMAVLDRLGDKAIGLFDPQGKPLGKLSLVGSGLPDPGLVSGVFIDGNRIYVEREHATLVLVGTTDGRPAESPETLVGRPSKDGTLLLSAGIVDRDAGRMYIAAIDRARGEHRFTRELRLGGAIDTIRMLDTDRRGIIYTAAELELPGRAPEIQVLCLEPERGALLGTATFAASTSAEETFRDFAVTDTGEVVFAFRNDEGVQFLRARCP
ncbi:MAG: hypothetical protein WCI05_05660 [Myxococcales bacterium]